MLAERLRLANEQINREAERVGRILRCLLPDPVPDIPGLEMAASFETFAHAGGDLYDFIRLDEGTNDASRLGNIHRRRLGTRSLRGRRHRGGPGPAASTSPKHSRTGGIASAP